MEKETVLKYAPYVVALVVIAVLVWVFYPKANIKNGVEQNKTEQAVDEKIANENKEKTKELNLNATQFSLKAEYDGQSLEELLNKYLKAEIKQFDYGKAIYKIGDRVADKKQFWAIYVNGEFVGKGLETVSLKKGDKVVVILERVEMYKGI